MIPDRPVVEFDAIYFQVLLFIVQLALVMDLLVLVEHPVQLPFQLHLVLRVPAPLQYFIVFLDLLLSDECYLFQPLMLFVHAVLQQALIASYCAWQLREQYLAVDMA